METSLLVLAAGMGSRFGGAKQVEAVGPSGETILEYSIYDALRAGFGEVVFLVRASMAASFREAVESRLPAGIRRRLAFQELDSLLGPAERAALSGSGRSRPWGTGHALLCAAGELGGNFAVVNADDFYGRESMRLVGAFLAAADPSAARWCLAGYRLGNTTSPHGTVARALCELGPGGRLRSLREHPAIRELPGGRGFRSALPEGGEAALDGEAFVSMNLWGFTPAVFRLAEPLFREFLRVEAPSDRAEFYLPALVGELVASGEAQVEVLPTPESWFGLTWREDLGAARARVAALEAAGAYPAPLWGAGLPAAGTATW